MVCGKKQNSKILLEQDHYIKSGKETPPPKKNPQNHNVLKKKSLKLEQ